MPDIGLNALDLLLLVILFIAALVGAIRGALPQLFSIISIWFGLVATLWLYKPLSNYILQGLGLPKIGSDTFAFLILLLVFFNAFRFIVKTLSTPPEERKQRRKSEEDPLAEAAKSATQRFVLGPLNLLGGGLMGVILNTLWIALILGAVQFIFQPTSGVAETYTGFSRRIVTNLNTSTLMPMFNQVLLLLSRSVELFIPKNADILKTVLEFIS
ncbi:MAG: CvpA family protein [Anaerolineae bacterium]|nr:CvpA family protein [Anaerolineae bacterium]